MRFNALIIEDDDALRQLYEIYLTRGQIHATSVVSASKALDALKVQPFDLILVDVNLGGDMNGLDLIQLVQNDPDYEHVKIVTLTSFPEPYEISRQLRIDLSLKKPINYESLMAELDQLMGDI